jgi:hypothetical protein
MKTFLEIMRLSCLLTEEISRKAYQCKERQETPESLGAEI